MNIIDFHVHAGDFRFLREDIQNLLTHKALEPGFSVAQIYSNADEMESYMRQQGVVRAIVIAECGPGTFFTNDSRSIANFAEKSSNSEFFITFGNINPNYHHNSIQEFWISVLLGVNGFKFYPADHSFDPFLSLMKEVYSLCEKFSFPIMFHTGLTAQKDTEQKFIHPFEFKLIAETYPNLVIILAHCGKPLWYKEAFTMASSFANVYLDTSLVEPKVLKEHIEMFPNIEKKIFFGSDWPVIGSYTELLSKYKQAGFSSSMTLDIFYSNAEKMLSKCIEKQCVANVKQEAKIFLSQNM